MQADQTGGVSDGARQLLCRGDVFHAAKRLGELSPRGGREPGRPRSRGAFGSDDLVRLGQNVLQPVPPVALDLSLCVLERRGEDGPGLFLTLQQVDSGGDDVGHAAIAAGGDGLLG